MIGDNITAVKANIGMIAKIRWVWYFVEDKDINTKRPFSYSDLLQNKLYWRENTYYVMSGDTLYKILGSEYDIWRLNQYMKMGLSLKSAMAKINK